MTMDYDRTSAQNGRDQSSPPAESRATSGPKPPMIPPRITRVGEMLELTTQFGGTFSA